MKISRLFMKMPKNARDETEIFKEGRREERNLPLEELKKCLERVADKEWAGWSKVVFSAMFTR